jgi:DHA2 family multidrug resistance protein
MTTPARGLDPTGRLFTTIAIMCAAVMQTLDTTIANIALPHMQGSVSASQDQIVWVLTSYIVAAAIMLPLTGWLSERLGRKTLFLVSVAAFTAASALCGAAQSLEQIVAFRFIQGLGGAALLPLAQAFLLDINPPEKYGQAMATFAGAVVLGPIFGPTLGGWLTENLSWRWVFYINLPFGVLAFLSAWLFMPGKAHPHAPRFDFFGYGALAVGLTAIQLMMDRGARNDWFGSTETWVEGGVGVTCIYLFVVHQMTAKQPLFDRRLFADRNFRMTCISSVAIMGALYASMALVPPMLQNFYGYPVFTAGMIIMPRGIGAFVTMATVGRIIRFVDARLLMGLGLVLLAVSFWMMSQFAPVQGEAPMVISGFIQGLSMGLIWVPMSTIAFATLPGHFRLQGATMSNLIRNIGGAIGISSLQVLLTNNLQVVRSGLMDNFRPDNPALQHFIPSGEPSALQLQMMNGMVMRQSALVAYIDNFWLMAILSLCMLPLLLFMDPAKPPAGPQQQAMAAD